MTEDGNKEPNHLPSEEDTLSNDQGPSEQRPPTQPPPQNHTLQVLKGIGLLLLLHLLLFLVPVAIFFISVAQLVYLIPALILLRKNKGIFQGLLIGAGITFLLNAACFGLLLGGNIRL
ncbi:hypothetical protein [Paenibacillus sp. OAS669]|uniref:hypothetical protein n=1 Tax=Paenibacillus sp. OAS669 TaxID=2663821 RepID=UPI00178B20D3|nr:hypothetical protein [Paenibacillus sp. OAS669]MBE1442989.1 hypothetical protein [Paenibacillus sp. OAS669]